jgi:integrase
MPRVTDLLDKPTIEAAIAEGKPAKLRDGGSLYLYLRGGSALWLYQFRDGKTNRTRRLGSYPDLSPSAARKARNGYDRTATTKPPVKTPSDAETFGDVLAAYLAEAGPSWGEHERTDFRNMLDKAPALLALAVDDVRPMAIADAVKAAYPASLKRQDKMRRRIAAVLKFAGTRHVRVKLAVKHHVAMAAADVPALMTELAAIDTATARALRFNILTASRSGETLGATWDEIVEVDGKPAWVHMRAHNKGGPNAPKVEHRVPLTPQAIACLGTRGSGLIFRSRIKGKGRLGHSVMSDLLATLRSKDVASVHGLRSTFRDWVTETTDFGRDLAELALAHAIKGATKSELSYAHGTQFAKRRALMTTWADLIAA